VEALGGARLLNRSDLASQRMFGVRTGGNLFTPCVAGSARIVKLAADSPSGERQA